MIAVAGTILIYRQLFTEVSGDVPLIVGLIKLAARRVAGEACRHDGP